MAHSVSCDGCQKTIVHGIGVYRWDHDPMNRWCEFHFCSAECYQRKVESLKAKEAV